MTRMWMINPKYMCRNHLLGEHKEIHQLLGTLKKGFRVTKYVKNNCIEITSMKERHDLLVQEMESRGYNHKSPLISQEEINELSKYLPEKHRNYKINFVHSFLDLVERCPKCSNGSVEWK